MAGTIPLVRRDETGRWLKGSIPNPLGRGAGYKSMATRLREIVNLSASDRKWAADVARQRGYEPKDISIGELIADVMAEAAIGSERPKGYASVLSVLYDRLEGKPTQRVEVSTDGVMSEAINGKADDLRQAFAEIDGAAETPALPDGGGSDADLAGN